VIPQTLASLATSYRDARALTERLAEPLSAEDQTIQTMADVSPTKWHRAHVTWFFETFILGDRDEYEPFDTAFGYLFNSYYETVGARLPRPRRGLLSRPGAAEIGSYRRHVDAAMDVAFDRGDLSPAVADLIELGVHHEQQHQELLLMDIKHVLAANPTGPTYLEGAGGPGQVNVGDAAWKQFDGGLIETGNDGEGFSYDNETPRHRTFLEPFEISDRLVSAGDWLEFIADGGYHHSTLWLSDGWSHIQEQNWDAPLYWRSSEDGWEIFTLGGWRKLALHEPVCHVSYYEADAFARWAGARLPSEAEWELAAHGRTPTGGVDMSSLHPVQAPGDEGWFGQVWQWTRSSYEPYPGFAPAEGAVGEYNGKFMCDQHVLRGGSCATPVGHTRPTYRNFFPASSRWPFCGIRLARDC
jgi:ergothioneine biosynthesis protein EgtB